MCAANGPQGHGLPAVLGEVVERIGAADIMVGIPSAGSAATIGFVVRASQAGLVQYFPDLRPVLVNADAGSRDDTQRVVLTTEPPDYIESILLVRPRNRLRCVSLTYPEIDGVGGKGASLRTVFELAAALGVQALVVVDSDLRSILPEWIELLAGPILKGGFDYVTPLYARHKWDGTITNALTYPLTRALYGLRVRQPIGGDFGISGDLVRHYLQQDDWSPDVSRFGIDIWMTTKAIVGGFAVCESRLGAKAHDPKDPGADLGPMFSQVLGSLLALTRQHADRWLPVVGSREVPAYGFERPAEPPAIEIDVSRLLSSVADGSLGAATTWAATLSPDHLDAVLPVVERMTSHATSRRRRPMSVPGDGPLMSDDLWAGVVYDLLLASAAGTVTSSEVVSSLMPLYHARVASFVMETREATAAQAEQQVDRLALAFEAAKPSFAARWRGLVSEPAPSAGAATGKVGESSQAQHPDARTSDPSHD
jgi:hypothetical protein